MAFVLARRLRSRRGVVRAVAVGMAAGAVGVVSPAVAPAAAQTADQGSAVGDIYRLQAAFHRAKTMQDLELMLSLWAPGGTLRIQGDNGSPYVGADNLRRYWQGSGSFKNRRLSLVPSFKTQIDVRGDQAWLYFECHDVGDYDLPTRAIAGDTFLAGTVRRVQGTWVFWDMAAGPSAPLSADRYFAQQPLGAAPSQLTRAGGVPAEAAAMAGLALAAAGAALRNHAGA